MLKDIVLLEDGFNGLKMGQSNAPKAANVLRTQLGSLEYAENFGVDLRFFLETDYAIENESFKAYAIERLIDHQVNVIEVIPILEKFLERYVFSIGQVESTSGFIA